MGEFIFKYTLHEEYFALDKEDVWAYSNPGYQESIQLPAGSASSETTEKATITNESGPPRYTNSLAFQSKVLQTGFDPL